MVTIALPVRAELPGSEMDPDEQITRNVLEYAENRLGYKHPAKDRLAVKGRLANAIRVAGIKPLTPESVDAYKQKMARSSAARRLTMWVYDHTLEINDRHRRVIPMSMLTVILSAIGSLIWLVTTPLVRSESVAVLVTGVVSLTLLATSGGYILWMLITELLKEKLKEWEVFPLQHYPRPVPEFALQTAQEIHQREPSTVFYIHELIVKKVISKDPFLVAILDDEKYYLEVWDEPGYKQKRKV